MNSTRSAVLVRVVYGDPLTIGRSFPSKAHLAWSTYYDECYCKDNNESVKLSICTPWGYIMEVWFHSLWTSALNGGELSATRPGRFCVSGKWASSSYWTGGWVWTLWRRVKCFASAGNPIYYRLWNLANNSLSLAIGFKPGIFCSLKMAHLYRNMSEPPL